MDQDVLKQIRLSCEMWSDDILCEDGIKMKNKIIHLLEGNITDDIETEINNITIITKAKLWDKALELADEGKMLKYMADKINSH